MTISPEHVSQLLSRITPGTWEATDFTSAPATENSPGVDKCKILAIQKKPLGAINRGDAMFIAEAPEIAREYIKKCKELEDYKKREIT